MSRTRTVSDADHVPADWMDGKAGVTVEDWGQRQWDAGQRAGRDEGITFAVNTLRQHAAFLWLRGNSLVADAIKAMADGLKADADKHMLGRKT